MKFIFPIMLCLAACAAAAEPPPVIINEVMYHPPRDQDVLQYVELFNRSEQTVDLSGWNFKGGLKFTFPDKSSIPAGGFLVTCRDSRAFQQKYGATIHIAGDFTGRLKHSGEKIELLDSRNNVVEKLKYADHAPWPIGPDGYASSLERICPEGAADDPNNWSSSRAAKGNPGVTPGRTNDSFSKRPLPVIEEVKWERCPKAGEPVVISANIKGTAGIAQAEISYTSFTAGSAGTASKIKMDRISGDEHSGQYRASIPHLTAGTLIRFNVRAADNGGAERIQPSANEPRSAFSAYALEPTTPALIPIVTVLNLDQMPRGSQRGNQKFGPPRNDSMKSGNTAFVYLTPHGKAELLDFVEVRRRSGGWKAHFFKDQLLDGMSGINIIFEGPPRWILSEYLSYELYRRAGVRTEKSGHVRLIMDGRQLGYHLFVEQPNKTFLTRTGANPEGNLYKILWYERGVVRQHEKKTNLDTGHADVVTLIDTLNKKSGAAQWAYIQEQFDVSEVASYYAVNMCIQNWDGFFNNYFTYHDTNRGGKWEIIPWDEDKTWGEYDGGPRDYNWFDMPLTTGMNGDSGAGLRGFFGGGGPFGGANSWWRPPGFFSGPLLANPQFRKQFEAKLRELCDTVFNEEKFGPIIEALKLRLRPEVAFRAQSMRGTGSGALQQFDQDIASYHRQLANRRKYILAHLSNDVR